MNKWVYRVAWLWLCFFSFFSYAQSNLAEACLSINEITAETGFIETSNHPRVYGSNALCSVTLSAPESQVIDIVFETLDIEPHANCAYDSVKIYDGSDANAPVLGVYCGQSIPPQITSTANQLFIVFKSDSSVQKTGFRMHYQYKDNPTDSTERACSVGGVASLNGEIGSLSSPNYGAGSYPNNSLCRWLITVPSEKLARLEFVDFGLEAGRDCKYDSFTVYDGGSINDRVIGQFCGQNKPNKVTGTANQMLVVFTSDHSVQSKGFKVDYSAVTPIDPSGHCGISDIPQKLSFRQSNTEQITSSIVGGKAAEPNSWPWMAGVQTRSSPTSSSWSLSCGASLISPTWVMTAAHCVEDDGITAAASTFRVVLGDHNRYINEDTEEVRLVKRVVKHPAYDYITTDNDIALLELSEPVRYGRAVQPTCLPSGEPPALRLSAVLGWGATEATGSVTPPTGSSTDSSVLNQVFVPIWEQSHCFNTRVGFNLTNNMFCAGLSEGGKDTCQGDSGGPLLTKVGEAYVQNGITSWGYGCAERNSPGVYTKVFNYIDWILNYATDHYLHQ